MKKRLTKLIVGLLLMISASLTAQVSTWDGTWEPWTHGTGTEDDPFLIENARQLAYLAYRVNNGLDTSGGHVSNHDYHYKLMVDVDLNGSETFQWSPIGYWNSNSDYQCFGGHFDGSEHSISSLYINSSIRKVGLFGYTDGAVMKSIIITGNSIITSSEVAGGVVGHAYNTSVINCINNCDVTSCYTSGGIAGFIEGATTIISCCNNASINSNGYICYSGGIVGRAYYSDNQFIQITYCYNKGGVYSYSNDSHGASGGVLGNTGGQNGYNSHISINNCYNVGDVIANYNTGGIMGYQNCVVYNSYYLNTCGGNNVFGGSPKLDFEMKTQEFVDLLNGGFCAYEMDYNFSNLGYPVLTGIIVSASTFDAIDITQSHATLYGNIEVENTSVQSQGFEYKKSSDYEWQSVSVSGSGDISKTLSDLTPSTQYRFRTFCTPEGCEIVYGQEKTFSTLAITVTTNNASDVTQSHATLNGTINAGDANISSQGFEYKKSSDYEWQSVSVSGSGDISKPLADLTPNTQYRFRTFCTLQGGETVYGQEKSFNTLAITVSTNYATNVTQTHATLEGIVNAGDANVWAGFDYKTQGASWHTVNVSGGGNITKTLSNLIPNTRYIYRTFCSLTASDTIYGEERELTTRNVGVATNPATDIDNNSAVLHGFVNVGDATLITKGFEYYQLNPSMEGPFVVYVTDEDYEISIELDGLDMFSDRGALYSYRSFVNIAEKDEIIYGQSVEFSWLDANEILVFDQDLLYSIAAVCFDGIETFENKTIILLNDIEFPVASENFFAIGSYPDHPFKGSFDGNGKTISNLAIGQTNTHYQGLFGYTQGSMISSLKLDNVNIYGRNYCGGVVGYAENTYIYESCIANSSINALNYCGGIVGYVEGEYTDVMGCYSTCDVSGNNYVGGLVGYSNMGAVRNSYAAGGVSGQGNAVGGILGGALETLMINSYFNTEITGQNVAIGDNDFKDGEGVTTAQMRLPQFVATMNQGITPAIWVADNIPYINNGFPVLHWQTSGGESCGAPQNLSHSISGNQITLNWAQVDEASYYIVKYATINGSEHTQVTEQNSFTFYAMQDSTYSWRVKSVCPNGESVFVNGNNVGLGVDENDAVSNHLVLYPNPANELVTIKLDDENYGLKMIKVFDISGREMVSVNVSGQEYNIDVSGLPKGVYIVRVVTDENNVANLKLLVK